MNRDKTMMLIYVVLCFPILLNYIMSTLYYSDLNKIPLYNLPMDKWCMYRIFFFKSCNTKYKSMSQETQEF